MKRDRYINHLMKREKKMVFEIGSNFWINPNIDKPNAEIDTKEFGIDFEDIVFTGSGRSAIKLVLSDIDKRTTALLPSFTCDSVIEPFISNGYNVSYYDLNEDLSVDRESFLRTIETVQPDVVLVHSHFGFNTLSNITDVLSGLKETGVVVIEDLTQSLYSKTPRINSTYYIGSLRKWAGLPDGGFASKSRGSFINHPTATDDAFERIKTAAMIAKYEYLFCQKGGKEEFLKKYADAESLLEQQGEVYLISKSSRIEQANLEIEDLINRRRENYLFLTGGLDKSLITPLFNELPLDVVPLYFPFFCKGDRQRIQTVLRQNDIYAPIIWPKPLSIDKCSESVTSLYSDLLCIPCDQRYQKRDMERIVCVLTGEL